MLWKKHILFLLSLSAIAFAAQPQYRVEEQGNNLILITPEGRRILFGEYNLPTEKAYEFEIPLSELSDEKVIPKKVDRAPASVPNPSPTPYYDVDWDWEEPDEDPVALVTPTPTPSPTPSPTPTPTPKVEYDATDSLILKANRLFHKGRYYETAMYVEEILRRKPEHMRAWLMKGSVLYKLGQKDLAQKAWQQAVVLDTGKKETQGILERFK